MTQDSRIKIKRSTTTSQVATVPSSDDHTDDTWGATDIYKGEMFLNQVDDTLNIRTDNGIKYIPVVDSDGVARSVSLTIASADVLTLNGTPLTLIAAPGAGKAIELLFFSTEVEYGTAAYATNTTLQLITDTATTPQGSDQDILLSTVSRVLRGRAATVSGTSDTMLIENKALLVKVATGNPTAGDSDITIRAYYRVINL